MYDITRALNLLIAHNVPFKALQKVKRYLRRECRKPNDMSVREYANNLLRINTEELPNIPPGSYAQRLSDDEILDILLFGTPKVWQTEMDRQGFDPLDSTIQHVVAFMERIEESELDTRASTEKRSSSVTPKPPSNDRNKSKDNQGGTKHCTLHGDGYHSTSECKTLQYQNKRLREDLVEYQEKRLQEGRPKGDFKKKQSWKSTADNSKTKTKAELNAIVTKAIEKEVRKELHSLQAKRKSDDSSTDEDEVFSMYDTRDVEQA